MHPDEIERDKIVDDENANTRQESDGLEESILKKVEQQLGQGEESLSPRGGGSSSQPPTPRGLKKEKRIKLNLQGEAKEKHDLSSLFLEAEESCDNDRERGIWCDSN